MKYWIVNFAFILMLSGQVLAQKDIQISWNYEGLSFKDFASKAETFNHLSFFYRDEWVSDLKMGPFQGPVLLSELLTNLFNGKSLYFFMDESGNVIVTKNFAIKTPGLTETKDKKFIPPTEYYESQARSQL